jgi:formamidopyrimidine-DNA glycosylase
MLTREGRIMIELPEAATLARQMNETLVGKRVARVELAQNRPKWMFLMPEAEAFSLRLVDRELGNVTVDGKWIFVSLDNGDLFVLGDFGGKLLLHSPGATLPKKWHLSIEFTGGAQLTLAIQMWGFVGVMSPEEIRDHPVAGTLGPSPTDDDFTLERFNEILDTYAKTENKPIKAFLIHEENLSGLGNGYLQDILFRAGLSPKRKVADIRPDERERLYRAIVETMDEAIELNGRDTETDLYGNSGGYVPILDKRAKGSPCPDCGTPIEKIQYLGGSCYICPRCQG